MSIKRSAIYLLACLLSLAWTAGYASQPGVPGFAEITNPAAGQRLTGLITIRGTADHPSFAGYELLFAHDPNPTETWFPLA